VGPAGVVLGSLLHDCYIVGTLRTDHSRPSTNPVVSPIAWTSVSSGKASWAAGGARRAERALDPLEKHEHSVT
jgi:hypothetical protein